MQVLPGAPSHLRSSVAEHPAFTRSVVGASPTGGTTSGCGTACAARLVWDEEVGGSNPSTRTILSIPNAYDETTKGPFQGGVTSSTRDSESRSRGANPRSGATPLGSFVTLSTRPWPNWKRHLASIRGDAGSNPAGRTNRNRSRRQGNQKKESQSSDRRVRSAPGWAKSKPRVFDTRDPGASPGPGTRPCSQLGRRRPAKSTRVGSIPTAVSIHTGVAQRTERFSAKEEAAGSNPAVGTSTKNDDPVVQWQDVRLSTWRCGFESRRGHHLFLANESYWGVAQRQRHGAQTTGGAGSNPATPTKPVIERSQSRPSGETVNARRRERRSHWGYVGSNPTSVTNSRF